MDASSQFAHVVRSLVTLRADRNGLLGHPLSAQAWDLIFVLFLADAENRPMREQDAAFIAGIDPEPGRRWVAYLRQVGIVIDCDRADEPCITLSPEAIESLRAVAARTQGGPKST